MRLHLLAGVLVAMSCAVFMRAANALGADTGAQVALQAALTEAAAAGALSDEDPSKWDLVSKALERLVQVREAHAGTEVALTAAMVEGSIRLGRPGAWEEIIAPLTYVVTASPDSWQAALCHHDLAYAHSSRGSSLAGKEKPDYVGAWAQYEAARADAEAALARLSTVPEAKLAEVRKCFPLSSAAIHSASSRLILGFADLRLGRVGEAIQHWNTVVGKFSDCPGCEEARIPLNARALLRRLGIAAGQAEPGEQHIASTSAREGLAGAGLHLSWDSQHRQLGFATSGLRVTFIPDGNLVVINGVTAHASPPLALAGDDVRAPDKLLSVLLAVAEYRSWSTQSTTKTAPDFGRSRDAAIAKLFAATR
jgi:hypothetical protein